MEAHMKYQYFISFTYVRNGNLHDGSAGVNLHEPITEFDHIRNVEKDLVKHNHPNAIVNNFILLKTIDKE
jgi:hypothetical protein